MKSRQRKTAGESCEKTAKKQQEKSVKSRQKTAEESCEKSSKSSSEKTVKKKAVGNDDNVD